MRLSYFCMPVAMLHKPWIKDNASPFLKQAHKELQQARSSLNQRAKIFLKKHNSQLMENMTTTIQGRLCVLVRAQDKHAFGGMVHGQSQSGLAYYMYQTSRKKYHGSFIQFRFNDSIGCSLCQGLLGI